ncbi:MAG: hypothetical protein PHX08_23230 [Lachnospiraceae bacterium]|nr:hypothetical protein [Lachnospiraceae bacterium]
MGKQSKWYFYREKTSFPGVVKIAEKVKKDIALVTGKEPEDYQNQKSCDVLVIYGTVGKSEILDHYEQCGVISLDEIRNKREVYGFYVREQLTDHVQFAVIIAGSDKRGTIYGLFHLSELLGVSPLVNWNHVIPEQKIVSLSKADTMISREPSIRYRGFFINDEWPAF